MSLCLANLFYLLNVYSQHSDIIPVSFHIAFSLKIVLLVSILLCYLVLALLYHWTMALISVHICYCSGQ
jgi:hypothetical protein